MQLAAFQLPFIASLIVALILAGCSPAVRNSLTEHTSPDDTYEYYATNDSCNCEAYTARDAAQKISYTFKATYSVNPGIATLIEIEFHNNSGETLHLDPGAVQISSRNVEYEYNGKFLPLPQLDISAHRSDHITLTGKDIRVSDNEWNKIAGEQLVISIRGMRLGGNELAAQSVTFIPKNPKMKNN